MSMIKQLNIIITDKCNNSCKHCSFNCSKYNSRHFDHAKFITLLKKALDSGIDSIDLSGGEPTMHPHFSKILETSLSSKLRRISLATNLHNIESLVCVLKNLTLDLNKLHLRISMDGSNEEEFDWLRGKGSFRDLINRLDIILKYVKPVSANTLVHRHNYKSIPAISKLVTSYGFHNHNLISILPFGRGLSFQKFQVANEVWFSEIPMLSKKLNSEHGLDYFIMGPINNIFDSEYDFVQNRTYGIIITLSGLAYPDCFYQFFEAKCSIADININEIDLIVNRVSNFYDCMNLKCKQCFLRYACYGLYIEKQSWRELC